MCISYRQQKNTQTQVIIILCQPSKTTKLSVGGKITMHVVVVVYTLIKSLIFLSLIL